MSWCSSFTMSWTVSDRYLRGSLTVHSFEKSRQWEYNRYPSGLVKKKGGV